MHEKRLEWLSETLDLQRGDQHRPDYRAINPRSVVPTLVHDGKVIPESTVIMEYLDEAFPPPSLMPSDPYCRASARLFLKRVDESLHAACATLTFAIAFRRFLLNKTPAELEARFREIRDPAVREARRLAVVRGMAAPGIPAALRCYDDCLTEMENALGSSTYLAGETYSLADAAIAPYVYRAELLGLDRLWTHSRRRVEEWFGRITARPSFEHAISGVLTDADKERLRVPREESWTTASRILGGTAPQSAGG